MVKKSAAVKKTAAKKTAATGKRRGRPPGSKNKTTTPTKAVSKPKTKKNNLPTRTFNDETGFVLGSDQDVIATELLAGGSSRQEIADRLTGMLEPTTRNGTEKQIVNMTGGVLQKLLARGFTIESSFVVNPPTPASKRAATRAASKKAVAAPANKKTAAKKSTPAKTTATGKRRGRPPGSKNKPKTGKAASKRK
jgi:hypothetical protein